jgi:hypothetical protein
MQYEVRSISMKMPHFPHLSIRGILHHQYVYDVGTLSLVGTLPQVVEENCSKLSVKLISNPV